MDLIFPFKNIAFNSLLDFVEKGKVKDYYLYINKLDLNSLFERYVEIYKDRIPDYENEILQIIETSSQDTIETYFRELISNVLYAKDLIEAENIKRLVKEWNDEELKVFEKKVSDKEEKFFQSENRKLKHLETYEKTLTLYPFFEYSRNNLDEKAINYNFFCIEDEPDLIDEGQLDKYLEFIRGLYNDFLVIAQRYSVQWHEGKVKSKVSTIHLKPIIFFEGELDLEYVQKAAILLNEEELLTNVELRQRGCCNNLDKLWVLMTENNWETVPQKKILVYDCDTNRENKDFGGHIYMRTIPKQDNLIGRGIENLFPDTFVKKAIEYKKEFVDFKETTGTERGKSYRCVENIINKHEKRSFCSWACENGQTADFKNFKIVFEFIKEVV
jgi:hypothetical protein